MQKLCQQIIQKFELKQKDIKNYDYNNQNQEGSTKLQNAYDYFLKTAPEGQNNLLYTQFTQKLKKIFETKQSLNQAKKRYSDTKLHQIQSYVFILIREQNEELCVFRYPQQTEFFNFFYIWAYSQKQAELQFIRDFYASFNMKISSDQISCKEQKINLEKNEFNLVFVNANPKQFNKEFIENKKKQYNIEFKIINRNSSELIENKNFFILKNFLPHINQHFESITKKKIDKCQSQTRLKSNSDPPRPQSLELSDSDSDMEEIQKTEQFCNREQRLNTRMQNFENSLDDILSKYGIKI